MQTAYESWHAFRDEAVPQRSTNSKPWNQSMMQFFSFNGTEQARSLRDNACSTHPCRRTVSPRKPARAVISCMLWCGIPSIHKGEHVVRVDMFAACRAAAKVHKHISRRSRQLSSPRRSLQMRVQQLPQQGCTHFSRRQSLRVKAQQMPRLGTGSLLLHAPQITTLPQVKRWQTICPLLLMRRVPYSHHLIPYTDSRCRLHWQARAME